MYIVNIAIRAAYRGFDLFTYKCDNHYIDYISGHSFNTGIRVGGGSEMERYAIYNTIRSAIQTVMNRNSAVSQIP